MSYAIYLTEEQLNNSDIVIWCPACGENLGTLCSDKIEEIKEKKSVLESCWECGQSFYIETEN